MLSYLLSPVYYYFASAFPFETSHKTVHYILRHCSHRPVEFIRGYRRAGLIIPHNIFSTLKRNLNRLGSFRRKQMDKLNEIGRLDQIPVIHVRGTHTVVGFTIGRQFKNMIDDLLEKWAFFNKIVLPAYMTSEGRHIYDISLSVCSQKYPQYVEELQGMAEGAKVPFYKLFLLHIESLIAPAPPAGGQGEELFNAKGETGCTTLMCNSDEAIIGHTEDACPEFVNNVYIVSAEILGEEGGETLEKFTTLTYAGHLPGYTMGYNHHGLVYTVNTLFPKETLPGKTPRAFLARAILGAPNFVKVLDILRDTGCGASDGFSLNIHFAKQEGTPVMHNVEISPNTSNNSDSKGVNKLESELSVLTLTHGDFHAHCNKYLRSKVAEQPGVAFESSTHRHKAISKHLKPNTIEKVKEVLSDESDADYPVFRTGATSKNKPDYVKTVAVGIFDLTNRKWSIYMEPPNKSKPVAVLPLEF